VERLADALADIGRPPPHQDAGGIERPQGGGGVAVVHHVHPGLAQHAGRRAGQPRPAAGIEHFDDDAVAVIARNDRRATGRLMTATIEQDEQQQTA